MKYGRDFNFGKSFFLSLENCNYKFQD
jgi:hypothetical protein